MILSMRRSPLGLMQAGLDPMEAHFAWQFRLIEFQRSDWIISVFEALSINR